MRRISSPGAYSLCSVNSIEVPGCRLWCIPEYAPSTITRARSSNVAMRASSVGPTPAVAPSRTAGGAAGARGAIALLRRLDGHQELIDQGARRDAVGLGVEVTDQAVDQDRHRQRPHVVVRDGIATV